MSNTRSILAMTVGVVLAAAACKGGGDAQSQGTASGTAPGAPTRDRIAAGGIVPAANALSAPRPAKLDPNSGSTLFSSMNCDGCHGGGAVGWVGPSLVDGRWRYGGTDDEIFTSIFYGRPKGMPAYGGVIGAEGVWNLVAYIKAQAVPPVVPTTSWLAGGNATNPPVKEGDAPAAAPAPAPTPDASESVAPEEMLGKYGCTSCHAVDHKVVGPALQEVAAKYRGQDVEATLVQKVRNGGSGVWGQIPMAPNPQVPEPDLHAIVKWLLTLK